MCLHYLPVLRYALTRPLSLDENGVHRVIEVAKEYNLIRSDIDDIIEITQWPDRPDPMADIPTKVRYVLFQPLLKKSYCIQSVTYVHIHRCCCQCALLSFKG